MRTRFNRTLDIRRTILIADDEMINRQILIHNLGRFYDTSEAATGRETLEKIREQGIDPVVKHTICFATRQRQDAAAKLAQTVDAMVVIGGRNSSNTTRLAEICEALCDRVFHIESTSELSPELFAGCASIGVTAGASTPEDQINSTVRYLEAL